MKRLSTLLFLACVAAHAFAAEYPAKPVRIIAPFPPGGSVDLIARLVANDLGGDHVMAPRLVLGLVRAGDILGRRGLGLESVSRIVLAEHSVPPQAMWSLAYADVDAEPSPRSSSKGKSVRVVLPAASSPCHSAVGPEALELSTQARAS